MADAVMNGLPTKKKILSLQFLLGWITLGIMSSLDVSKQLDDDKTDYYGSVWVLCLLGPFTIILSPKILFENRKMGTLWETSGKPNFHPIVYNMGGPLFVWGWFLFFLGTSAVPCLITPDDIYAQPESGPHLIPLFLNGRTLLAFVGGCAMVPVVRFLDYSHDENGPWCGENDQGKVFQKWWLGTDGTYFGLFLESPWPFVMAWTVFGFSSFVSIDNKVDPDIWAVLMRINCALHKEWMQVSLFSRTYMLGTWKARPNSPFRLFSCSCFWRSTLDNIGVGAPWHCPFPAPFWSFWAKRWSLVLANEATTRCKIKAGPILTTTCLSTAGEKCSL